MSYFSVDGVHDNLVKLERQIKGLYKKCTPTELTEYTKAIHTINTEWEILKDEIGFYWSEED